MAEKITPNPQRLIEDQIGDDYIALTQRPNYKSEAAWQNEGERPGYIQVNKLRFLRPYQLRPYRRPATGRAGWQRPASFRNGQWHRKFSPRPLSSSCSFGLDAPARSVPWWIAWNWRTKPKKAFVALLSADFQTVIYKEKRDDLRRAEIVVTTVQSLLFNNKYQTLFSPTDFDLVISDEAHRSIGGNARAVFDYFVGSKSVSLPRS